MKKHHKQSGFAAVELVLILIIVVLIGIVGWMVYKNRNKTTSSTNGSNAASNKTRSDATVVEAKDETLDWTPYSTQEGQYSLKHPKTWVQAESPSYCSTGLLLLGADSKSVGRCATENFGQMGIDSSEGNHVADYELKKTYYSDLVTEPVTVDGVVGQKQSGSFSGPVSESGFGPDLGEKQIKYLFFTNNRTYSATYYVKSTYTDVLNDFNTMVTKTLKFHP